MLNNKANNSSNNQERFINCHCNNTEAVPSWTINRLSLPEICCLISHACGFVEHGPSHYASNATNVIDCDVGLAGAGPVSEICRCVHGMGTGVSLLAFFGVSPSDCAVSLEVDLFVHSSGPVDACGCHFTIVFCNCHLRLSSQHCHHHHISMSSYQWKLAPGALFSFDPLYFR